MTGDGESQKTIVLGFDALDFRYLDRFSDALPNFRRLREGGVEAPLTSTMPPWTGSAWPSMYTGTDPSHHGVFGFFRYDGYPDSGEIVSRSDVSAPALWNYVSSEGDSSVVLNVPVTHPAESIEGALVPGYLATEDDPGSPEGIREEISDSIGEEYRIYSQAELASDSDEKLRGYRDLIDLRRRSVLSLLEERDWRLAVVQVQKTDAVFHNFDDDEAFRAIYEAADELLGDVLDAVDDSVNVVVCSDHGIGPVQGYQIHVNEVLREHGYVEATDETDQLSLKSEKQRLVGEADDEPTEEDGDAVLPRVVDGLSSVGITPQRVYATAKRFGVEDALVDLTPTSLGSVVSETVDWRASKAYCRKATRLGVRINLEGREPDGVVAPDDYEAVRDDLIDILSDLTTPDGKSAFDVVAPREEFYDGPYADRAPDVITIPRGMDNSLSTALYGQRFLPVDKHDHKRTGVFLGTGPAFEAGSDVESLSLDDVAPITMALLGLPVPERMTGQVPDDLLSTPAERAPYEHVEYGSRDTADRSDAEVTERLEDLGYL